MRKRLPGTSLLVLMVLIATSCSSTNRRSADARDKLSDAPGSASAVAAGSTPGKGPDGVAGMSDDVVDGGTENRAGGKQRPVTGAHGGSGGPLTGRGFTAKSIKIGVHIYSDTSTNATYAAYGIDPSAGTQSDYVDAVVRYINTNGGIAGRKIDPAIIELDATQAAGPRAEAEEVAACESFANDHKVFAVASPAPTRRIFFECMSKNKTPVVVDQFNTSPQSIFDQYSPHLYNPAGPSSDRMAKVIVDGLYAAGYFGKNPKIGVTHQGTPEAKELFEKLLVPALAARGLKVAEVSQNTQASDAQGHSSTVFRFKERKVTHVLALGALNTQLFMSAAESQGYRPRYGLSSNNGLELLQVNVPPAQLEGSLAVGWVSSGDTDMQHRPALHAAERRCLDILTKAGAPPPGNVATGQLLALWVCDVFFFLDAAIERSSSISPAAIGSAVDSFGTSYRSLGTFSSEFKPGRRDGADSYRPLRFDSACSCFVYSGAARPFE